MSKEKKEQLIHEAVMQSLALKRIALWRNLSVLCSALGILAVWFGLHSEPQHHFIALSGIVSALLFMAASAVCHIGIRNGTANVRKILDAAEIE